MKRLLTNTFLIALFSIFVVSCAKEKVQPFSGGTSTNNFSLRDGGEDTNGDGVVDELDIVDGGNSSDYDSKGKKKKNP